MLSLHCHRPLDAKVPCWVVFNRNLWIRLKCDHQEMKTRDEPWGMNVQVWHQSQPEEESEVGPCRTAGPPRPQAASCCETEAETD